MNCFYNGPHGECSEQMYKLWQLLNAKGITLYNGFLPKGSFFFEIGNDRYTVWDEPDGNGLHMVWTVSYERDHRSPYHVRSHGYEREFGYWKCSECGTNCFEGARYCMNCGAKVVGE